MISNEQLQDLVEDDENLDFRDIWRFFSRPGPGSRVELSVMSAQLTEIAKILRKIEGLLSTKRA